jgi:hypothetical protein
MRALLSLQMRALLSLQMRALLSLQMRALLSLQMRAFCDSLHAMSPGNPTQLIGGLLLSNAGRSFIRDSIIRDSIELPARQFGFGQVACAQPFIEVS